MGGFRMNLDEAIAAHQNWKVKFRRAIDEKQQLDVPTISRDNCCDLGKWLHGMGKMAHGMQPQFQALVSKHRDFHAEAGKVAGLINAKCFDAAEKAISGASSYTTASNSVALAINALKKTLR